MTRARLLLTALVAVPVVAACGTTIPGSTATGREATDGLGTSSQGGEQPVVPGAGTPEANAPAQPVPGSRPGRVPAAVATAEPVSPGGAVRPVGGSPVTVGVVVVNNSSLAAFGGSSEQSTGDEQATYEALFAAANAAGGLAGHPIKAVYYDVQATSGRTQAQADQEMCARFTQDHKAVAVLTSENTTGDGIRECLSRARIPFIKNYLADAGEATLRANPGFVVPDSLNLDRIAAVMPGALHRHAYFGTRPVIGIVTEDSPDFAYATDKVLVPGIQRLGFQVKSIARFPNITDESSLQKGSTAAGSAIVRFRGDAVDHVLFLSRNGINVTLFANAAESQGYRPRYGFSSQDAAQALVTSGIIQNPNAQLRGALTVGWLPALDVPFGRSSPYLQTPQAKSCLSRVAKKSTIPSNTQGLFHVILNCDAVDVLLRAFAGRPLGVPSFVAGVEALRTSFTPVGTFATRFGPGRHDGAALTRVAAFADGRFTYRGTTSAA